MSASMNGNGQGHDYAPWEHYDIPPEGMPTGRLPDRIDINELAYEQPARPLFLLPTLAAMPIGEVTLLSADGGTGKSQFALALAVSVALGDSFFGEPILRRMPVAYLSYEDSREKLHWRLDRACWAAQRSVANCTGNLDLYDGTKMPGTWFARNESLGLNTTTLDYDAMRLHLLETGAKLIVIDGASDVFSGNENDRAAVKGFIRSLRAITPDDGACLLVAHVDKASAQKGKSSLGYSGSTGWNNSVRARWYMYRETEGEGEEADPTGNVVVEVRKSNYGATGASMTLRYNDERDVLERVDAPVVRDPAQDRSTRSGPLRDAEERISIVSIIREADAAGIPIPTSVRGSSSAHALMAIRPNFPDRLKTTKRGIKAFYALLNQLEVDGKIARCVRKRPNRHPLEIWVPCAS